MLATYIKEAAEAFVQPCKFLLVLLVCVFQRLELTGRINIVARIDAHLLDNRGSHIGHIGVEVNVSAERHVAIATCNQSGLDVAQVLSLARALRGEANKLSSSLDDAYGLLNAALRVERGTSRHALHSHAVLATNAQLAYLYFVCLASHVKCLLLRR